jgi:hypothetical protein
MFFKGRFAAVCAARCGTPNEQQNNNELCPPPTPCSSIRDRQVLNRTPVLPTNNNNNNSHNQYYTPHLTISPQTSASNSISKKMILFLNYMFCFFVYLI